MPSFSPLQTARRLALPGLVVSLLSGCNAVVMKPSGDIAMQQSQLIVTATALMLLIVVPVIVLILVFAWRYRQSNTAAAYEPDWDHSTRLELVIWGAPLLIIIALGAVTWISTHKLDPYRPLERLDAQRPLDPSVKPLEIQVVALDWKWLFIYPEQGIATVNELAVPVDRPVQFKITSSTVMNAFYVPALAGMIYAMPGMETKLHAVINHEGEYQGMSSQYSGAGFSGMHFKFHGLSEDGFAKWVASNHADGQALSRAAYLQLEQPTEREPVRRYASVEDGLYGAILNRCVDSSKMCLHQMAAIDNAGGLGIAGIDGLTRQSWRAFDGSLVERQVVAAALCTPSGTLPSTALQLQLQAPLASSQP